VQLGPAQALLSDSEVFNDTYREHRAASLRQLLTELLVKPIIVLGLTAI